MQFLLLLFYFSNDWLTELMMTRQSQHGTFIERTTHTQIKSQIEWRKKTKTENKTITKSNVSAWKRSSESVDNEWQTSANENQEQK